MDTIIFYKRIKTFVLATVLLIFTHSNLVFSVTAESGLKNAKQYFSYYKSNGESSNLSKSVNFYNQSQTEVKSVFPFAQNLTQINFADLSVKSPTERAAYFSGLISQLETLITTEENRINTIKSELGINRSELKIVTLLPEIVQKIENLNTHVPAPMTQDFVEKAVRIISAFESNNDFLAFCKSNNAQLEAKLIILKNNAILPVPAVPPVQQAPVVIADPVQPAQPIQGPARTKKDLSKLLVQKLRTSCVDPALAKSKNLSGRIFTKIKDSTKTAVSTIGNNLYSGGDKLVVRPAKFLGNNLLVKPTKSVCTFVCDKTGKIGTNARRFCSWGSEKSKNFLNTAATQGVRPFRWTYHKLGGGISKTKGLSLNGSDKFKGICSRIRSLGGTGCEKIKNGLIRLKNAGYTGLDYTVIKPAKFVASAPSAIKNLWQNLPDLENKQIDENSGLREIAGVLAYKTIKDYPVYGMKYLANNLIKAGSYPCYHMPKYLWANKSRPVNYFGGKASVLWHGTENFVKSGYGKVAPKVSSLYNKWNGLSTKAKVAVGATALAIPLTIALCYKYGVPFYETPFESPEVLANISKVRQKMFG